MGMLLHGGGRQYRFALHKIAVWLATSSQFGSKYALMFLVNPSPSFYQNLKTQVKETRMSNSTQKPQIPILQPSTRTGISIKYDIDSQVEYVSQTTYPIHDPLPKIQISQPFPNALKCLVISLKLP